MTYLSRLRCRIFGHAWSKPTGFAVCTRAACRGRFDAQRFRLLR